MVILGKDAKECVYRSLRTRYRNYPKTVRNGTDLLSAFDSDTLSAISPILVSGLLRFSQLSVLGAAGQITVSQKAPKKKAA